MSEVSFNVSSRDAALIRKIITRAKRAGLVRGKASPDHWYEPLTATMDLTAAHANGCRLDLERFLAFDDFNFTHDVAGIARHMNRETGRLGDHFLPRAAMRPSRRMAA